VQQALTVNALRDHT